MSGYEAWALFNAFLGGANIAFALVGSRPRLNALSAVTGVFVLLSAVLLVTF